MTLGGTIIAVVAIGAVVAGALVSLLARGIDALLIRWDERDARKARELPRMRVQR